MRFDAANSDGTRRRRREEREEVPQELGGAFRRLLLVVDISKVTRLGAACRLFLAYYARPL